jgi:putative transposase
MMDDKNRKSIRIKGYDYSQNGAYFVTICTHNKLCLFGQVESGKMVLNKLGLLVENIWREISKHYESVLIDEFVIMPNHIHGIIWLDDRRAQLGVMNHAPTPMMNDVNVAARLGVINHAPTQMANDANVGAQFIAPEINITAQFIAPKTREAQPTLGEVVRAFKARASQASKTIRSNDSKALWQRNYYEHVARNEPDLQVIREYINNNPKQWHLDRENPDA